MKTRMHLTGPALAAMVLLGLGGVAAALFIAGGARPWVRPQTVASLGITVEGSAPHTLRDLLALSPDKIQ
jgi:hypothetical protein